MPMSVDHIRYDLLTQDALRGVIRVVLTDVAVKGLPGDHHFYITFDTRVEGVRLSGRLKASYPEEMTIVLQHQFWDLEVREEEFDVGLAFHGIPERLHVPFRAIKAFMDPSVQFGLQFAVESALPKETVADTEADKRPEAGRIAPADKRPPPPSQPRKESAPPPVAPTPPSSLPAADLGSAEVVRLDRFRKK
jgi:uncharacterized protein